MTELLDAQVLSYREEWIRAGSPVPLVVSRSRYDDETRSWEVSWHERLWDGKGGSSAPIAEFDNWDEAQAWAQRAAREHRGVCRIGRDRIVGPMPPDWDTCQELGLDYYAGPPWPPVRVTALADLDARVRAISRLSDFDSAYAQAVAVWEGTAAAMALMTAEAQAHAASFVDTDTPKSEEADRG